MLRVVAFVSIITQLFWVSSVPSLPSRTPLACAIQRSGDSPAVRIIKSPFKTFARLSCVVAATWIDEMIACMSLFIAAYWASVRVALSFGIAMAASIPTTAMTNTNSIRLNAPRSDFALFCIFFLKIDFVDFLCIFSSLRFYAFLHL